MSNQKNIQIITHSTKLSTIIGYILVYPDFVKGVVDLQKKVLAIGGELHADAEALLLEAGSKSQNLWGFNIYYNNKNKIAYESLINIKPREGNRGLEVADKNIRADMKKIIDELLA